MKKFVNHERAKLYYGHNPEDYLQFPEDIVHIANIEDRLLVYTTNSIFEVKSDMGEVKKINFSQVFKSMWILDEWDQKFPDQPMVAKVMRKFDQAGPTTFKEAE